MNTTHFKEQFTSSKRKHILNITNHGIHQWKIVPGLTDTGGQNIFVNSLTNELVKRNYKVTIINRGGFKHPKTGQIQSGIQYKNPYQRIYYLEDGFPQFVVKENMGDRLPSLFTSLAEFVDKGDIPVDILITHYWDAGILGMKLKQALLPAIKHIWIPHSLGAIKDKIISPHLRSTLRMQERIDAESEIINNVDGIGVTSSIIETALRENYKYTGKLIWLPPCVDTNRYHSHHVGNDDPIWDFLSQRSGLPIKEIQKRRIISEISRTDKTKRKNVLIDAFADLIHTVPDAFLIISIDDYQKDLSKSLNSLIHDRALYPSVAVVGSVRDQLPTIYAISDIYCTPSVMEGFGMSAQEAAATKVPVISSDKVAFVTENLLGNHIHEVEYRKGQSFLVGKGSIVVPTDDVEGFKYALEYLLTNDKLRKQMGDAAYDCTIPYFTWENIGKEFISALEDWSL